MYCIGKKYLQMVINLKTMIYKVVISCMTVLARWIMAMSASSP